MMTYDQYITQVNGKQITKYGGQCVAGIAEFEAENNRPIIWGEKGAVLWINNPTMLACYDWTWKNPNDSGQVPERGDIVVWDEHTPYTNGSGHIAFFDRTINSQYFMSFGQNSGGETMHFAQVHWAHVAGWYHLKSVISPEPKLPFTLVDGFIPKLVRTNQNPTYKYGLEWDYEYLKAHPVAQRPQGDVFMAVAKVIHSSGHHYYRDNIADANGYEVGDCDDYTPPPPTPPAAPVEVKKAEKYSLLTTVMSFASPNEAIFHKGMAKPLEPGDYFVYAKTDKAYNLTTNNVKDQNTWVNTDDNVAPAQPIALQPAVATPIEAIQDIQPAEPVAVWKPTYTYLRSDKQPIVFKSVNAHEYPILDYSTGQPTIYMPPKHTVKAIDKFTDSKGSVYYRSESMAADGLGYGIPKALLQEAVFDTTLSRAERLAMKSASFVDKAYYAWIKAEKNMKFLDGIKSVFAGINQGRKK